MNGSRTLVFFASAIAIAAVLVDGCSSSGDYEGGGRRLYPPGGGDGTVLGTVDTSTPDDTNTPPDDTFVPRDSGTDQVGDRGGDG